MKSKKQIILTIFLCVCLLLSLCGCQSEALAETPKEPSAPQLTLTAEVGEEDASAILEYLSSAVFQGRAVGSDGNGKAAHYIADFFAGLGYAPFGTDYCVAYKDNLVRQESADPSLILIAKDGTRTSLLAGEDYIYYPVYEPIDVTLPICEDKAAAINGEAIYYAPEENTRLLTNEKRSVIAFQCADLEKEITLNNNTEPDRSTFFLIDSRFADQLSQPGVQAEIHLGACAQEGDALNVAAIRRGSVGKTALIISAHFDGSGFYGDVFYPSAYDNASGTTAMLLAAQMLADCELEPDLIFAAFNGEEAGINGSAALASSLCEGYDSVTVVNIDCIGLASDDAYTISGNVMKFSELVKHLDNYAVCQVEMPSDHLSFGSISNAIATNLADASAMEYATSLMHTRADTADKISPSRLLRAAQIVRDYALGGVFPSAEQPNFDNMKLQFEIPYKLEAYQDLNQAFFGTLPRNAGCVLDKTYASYDELQKETGIRLLHGDSTVGEKGVVLSVWSHTDQPEDADPVYQVSIFSNEDYLGIPVSISMDISIGESIDTSIRYNGEEDVRVTESSYPIAAFGLDARIYGIENLQDGTIHTVSAITADNVLYTFDMDGTVEQMQQYLESIH